MTFHEPSGLTTEGNHNGGDSMPQTLVLVGTRKGLFTLTDDGDRSRWTLRGPLCEGWPIYNAVYDAATGTIYASAASEWHGAGVWRSHDLGESWQLSSEGLSYAEDSGMKLSKISGLTVTDGRLLVGVEPAGIFETTDDFASWTPRNKGLRADWPRPHEEIGFCVHKLVRSPVDTNRLYQQNHCGMHRSDDGALTWTEITEGLPPSSASRPARTRRP